MINKQNLWFLTLFSIILVLSVYYVSLPEQSLTRLINGSETTSRPTQPTISEADILAALRVENDEMMLREMSYLQGILLDTTVSAETKSNAFDRLQAMNLNRGRENSLEALILREHNLKSFIRIKDDVIEVTISSNEGSYEHANNIMRTLQNEFEERMYITVKYQ